MSPPSEQRQPRPADLAILIRRMLTALLRKIWKRDYRRINPSNMTASLPLMLASFHASIATKDGKPLTVTQLGTKMKTPTTTVNQYAEKLVPLGGHKIVNGRKRGKGHEKFVVADLDLLDAKTTLEETDSYIAIIRPALEELERLREVLLEQLIANGNGAMKVLLTAWPAMDYVFG